MLSAAQRRLRLFLFRSKHTVSLVSIRRLLRLMDFPSALRERRRPDFLEYPNNNIDFGHYARNFALAYI